MGSTQSREGHNIYARTAKKTGEKKKEDDTPFEKAMRAVKICTRTMQSFTDIVPSTDEMEALRKAKAELDDQFEKLKAKL